jgi:hypothetical protein
VSDPDKNISHVYEKDESPCEHKWPLYRPRNSGIVKRCLKCGYILIEKTPCQHPNAYYIGIDPEAQGPTSVYRCESCREDFKKEGCWHLHRAIARRELETNAAGEQLYLYYETCLDCGERLVKAPEPYQDSNCTSCHRRGTVLFHRLPSGKNIALCTMCGKYTDLSVNSPAATITTAAQQLNEQMTRNRAARDLLRASLPTDTLQEQRIMQGIVNTQLEALARNMTPAFARSQPKTTAIVVKRETTTLVVSTDQRPRKFIWDA